MPDYIDTAFTSAERYEYINKKSSVIIPASGLGNKQTVTHNLGYVPFFRLFVQYPGRSFYEPVIQAPIDQGNYTDYQIFTPTIDTSKIQVAYLNNTLDPDPSIRVYCRVYAEPQS